MTTLQLEAAHTLTRARRSTCRRSIRKAFDAWLECHETLNAQCVSGQLNDDATMDIIGCAAKITVLMRQLHNLQTVDTWGR